MKISLDWIKEYVDLEGVGIEPIAHALTMVGFEVEGIETVGLPPLANVVVGEIVSYTQHPNADRLSLCQVDVGDGEIRSIVCGAKNFATGDRVLAALPGAVLPGNFKIKVSKLRGVESQGMLCSESELGLAESSEGIAILTDRPALGTAVNALYPEADTVFDIEVTPNRPDALSYLGIARELAAWFQRSVCYPQLQHNPLTTEKGALIESVQSLNPRLCPHYRGYSIRGVKIGDSPEWLKRRLQSVGLRPINNVVDITNFVLLETGQPLHAFDVKKIRGGQIRIRMAEDGEKIVTLDEKTRVLNSSDMVIADAERALVIAGVMGSVDAEVDAATTDIFLESAYFSPSAIRRTSKRLGLSTDSSYRFERGVDPKGAEFAALRCAEMILQLAGGTLLGPPLVDGQPLLAEQEIEVTPQWIRSRLGFDVADEDIKNCLERLELLVNEAEDDKGEVLFRVGIPSFRMDLYRPIDLVEEVIRIYGSDRIPEGEQRATATLMEDSPIPVYQRQATELLVGRGLQETVHYTLRKEDEVRQWFGHAHADSLALENPLASDASHLRVSLLPGLLDCLKLNYARHNEVYGLFEAGRIYREYAGKVYELFSIGFVLPQVQPLRWGKAAQADFYTAKRIAFDLLEMAGIVVNDWQVAAIADSPTWQTGHAGICGSFEDSFEAKIGVLDIAMTQAWDIEPTVIAGSLVFKPEIFDRLQERVGYQPLSLYPPAIRDLAVVVAADFPAGRIEAMIRDEVGKLLTDATALESATVFDIYAGEPLGPERKSVACRLSLRHPGRTLQDKEVNALFQQLLTALDALPGIEVRR